MDLSSLLSTLNSVDSAPVDNNPFTPFDTASQGIAKALLATTQQQAANPLQKFDYGGNIAAALLTGLTGGLSNDATEAYSDHVKDQRNTIANALLAKALSGQPLGDRPNELSPDQFAQIGNAGMFESIQRAMSQSDKQDELLNQVALKQVTAPKTPLDDAGMDLAKVIGFPQAQTVEDLDEGMKVKALLDKPGKDAKAEQEKAILALSRSKEMNAWNQVSQIDPELENLSNQDDPQSNTSLLQLEALAQNPGSPSARAQGGVQLQNNRNILQKLGGDVGSIAGTVANLIPGVNMGTGFLSDAEKQQAVSNAVAGKQAAYDNLQNEATTLGAPMPSIGGQVAPSPASADPSQMTPDQARAQLKALGVPGY